MLKNIEHLLQNLKMISKIPEYGKIKVDRNNTIDIDDSYGIFRFLYGNNRITSIETIKMIIDAAVDKCKDIVNSKYFDEYHNNPENMSKIVHTEFSKQKELLDTLYTELKNTQVGLVNLKITYNDDMTIVSKIEILLKKIENFTIDLEKFAL